MTNSKTEVPALTIWYELLLPRDTKHSITKLDLVNECKWFVPDHAIDESLLTCNILCIIV